MSAILVAFGGKADIEKIQGMSAFDSKRTFRNIVLLAISIAGSCDWKITGEAQSGGEPTDLVLDGTTV